MTLGGSQPYAYMCKISSLHHSLVQLNFPSLQHLVTHCNIAGKLSEPDFEEKLKKKKKEKEFIFKTFQLHQRQEMSLSKPGNSGF